MPSNQPSSLLHTKLMLPRSPVDALPREHLLARLDEGLARKVSLVMAPTGFGKTTLVRTWLAHRTFPAAWVTFDEHDNDPVRFWMYVCSAVRTLDASLGKATLSMLASPQPPSFASLLTPLLNDLAQLQSPAVFVLDDYHTIWARDIQKGMSFLIQQLPESFHLVFLTRSTPDLPLGILRARDELIEIGVADLHFSQQEAEAFLQTALAANLSSSTMEGLLQKTEGWPAGLRLAVRALQNKGDTVKMEHWLESFSGSERYIADYLIQEVFESQPSEIKSFLMRTSFLKRLTGSLCDAVLETNRSAATLEQLERDNLFITQLERSGNQSWYRYSPLFAESLQYFARGYLADGEIQSLLEKAAAWYEHYGLLQEAIETALNARLFDRAIAWIETFIEIHDLSEIQTIHRWLESIPTRTILLHPVICFTYAQVLLYSGDRFAPGTATQIEPFLSAAESAWREQEDSQRLGQLLSFRGNVAWWQGDVRKAFEYARQALNLLPEHDVFWRGNSLLSVSYEALSAGQILEAQDLVLEARALLGAVQNIYGVLAANQFQAEIFYWQGELVQAEQVNRQIQRDAIGDESMLDDQGIAALNLAHVAYERNELGQAEELATQALNLGRQRANQMLEAQASVRLAHIFSAKGDPSRSHELLKSLEPKIPNPGLLREIHSSQVLLFIREGRISSLEWWVNLISDGHQNVLLLQREREAFTLARLQIAEGKTGEALESLRPWQEDAIQNGRVRSLVEVLCLEALARHADGNVSQATGLLGDALTIGQPKGFCRVFLDEGSRMAALLQATLPTLANRSLHFFVATLLHSLPHVTPSKTASSSPTHVEPLSQQELRVLRLLVAGLSNADIAKELIVSTNTIKTHVKSIYRKLNVNSRTDAREVARGLKLL